MTKKKRIITRLLVVLAALTLISCCFLGSTFARYTSSNSGSASVTVAKWEVSMTGDGIGETAISFGNLSPSKDAWVSGSERKNSTAQELVATINNNSAVAAEITITSGTVALVSTATASDTDYNAENAKKVFSVDLYYTVTPKDGTEGTKTKITDSLIIAGTEVAATGSEIAQTSTVKIYAQVTWTTQDSGSDGTAGDEIDTMVGKYVTSVTVPVTYTATQATQIPAGA